MALEEPVFCGLRSCNARCLFWSHIFLKLFFKKNYVIHNQQKTVQFLKTPFTLKKRRLFDDANMRVFFYLMQVFFKF